MPAWRNASAVHSAARRGAPPCLRGAAGVSRMLRERADTGDGQVLLQLIDVSIPVDVDVIDDLVHDRMIVEALGNLRIYEFMDLGSEGVPVLAVAADPGFALQLQQVSHHSLT